MSSFSKTELITPYGENDDVLELYIDSDAGYFMRNVVKVPGEYTFSIWVRSDDESYAFINLFGSEETFKISSEWQRVSVTSSIDDIYENNFVCLSTEINKNVYFYEACLFKGAYDLDWKPAPEDVEDEIDSAFRVYSELRDDLDLLSTEFEISQRGISATIIETMTSSEDWQYLKTSVTDLKVTAGAITVSLADSIENTNDFINEFYTNFQIASDGLTIGKSGSGFQTRLNEVKLSFLQNGTEVAYIQYNRLYIKTAQITDSLNIGIEGARYVSHSVSNGVYKVAWTGGT